MNPYTHALSHLTVHANSQQDEGLPYLVLKILAAKDTTPWTPSTTTNAFEEVLLRLETMGLSDSVGYRTLVRSFGLNIL